MNEKDAATLAVLASLGLREEPKLTPEQEQLYKQATDSQEQYYADLLRIFTPRNEKHE